MTAKIIGWGRPDSAMFPTYHAITSRDDRGAVVTACRGRWSIKEPQVFHPMNSDTRVRLGECCIACVREVGGETIATLVWALTADDDETVVLDVEGP